MLRISKFFLAMGLMCGAVPVFAGNAAPIIHGLFGDVEVNSQITNIQQVGGPIGNLIEYQVTFQDPTWPAQYIYVDNTNNPNDHYQPAYGIKNGYYNGSYNVPGYTGHLITSPLLVQLAIILSHQLNPGIYGRPSLSSLNSSLTAYRTPGFPAFLLYTNPSQQYIESGGSIQDMSGYDINNFQSLYASYSSFAYIMYNLVNNGNFGTIIEGNPKAKSTILVMGEPNCPYCNAFYTVTKPYVDSGQLQIHWNLISFIDQDSRGKILAILMGDVPKNQKQYPATPLGAFEYNEDNFNVGHDDGGKITPIKPAAASQAVLNESNNAEFFFSTVANFQATPTIFGRDKAGNYQIWGGAFGLSQPLNWLGPNFTETAQTSQAVQNFVNNLYVSP